MMAWKKFRTWFKGFLNDRIKDMEVASFQNLGNFWMDFYHEVIHPKKEAEG